MNAATRAASISAVIALVLAAVWLSGRWRSAAAPRTSRTHGISMEPRFHTGDLAILRSDASYSVGDVVAYRSESLDTVVMHRIVAQDGDNFVIQGDNNDWLDDDKPVAGRDPRQALPPHPPGRQGPRRPQFPGPLVVIGITALTVIGAARAPGRRRDAPPVTPAPSLARPASRCRSGRGPGRSPSGSGAVALLAAAGGGVLLALPSTQTESRTLQVTQQGQFSYTGAAVTGTTYPTGTSRPANRLHEADRRVDHLLQRHHQRARR